MEESNAERLAMTALNKFIRNNGMRYTQERETILRTIYNMGDKISVEDILTEHERMYPDKRICRSTVYNCIRLLLELNIINEMKDKNNTVYRKVFGNGNVVELICKRCRKTHLVVLNHGDMLMNHLGSADFQVQSYRLTLYGLCSKCRLKY